MSPTLVIAGVVLLSLVLRVAFAWEGAFGRDEIAIYENALGFYLSGNLPTSGAEIVYTGTRIPGSLLPLLTGLPLWVSGGLPWGSALFVALLNFVAALWTLSIYTRLFPGHETKGLAWLILLAPWGVFYTQAWNPSFLPLMGVAFFWALLRYQRFSGSLVLGLVLVATYQIHLSVVLLGIILVAHLWYSDVFSEGERPNLGGFLVGAGLGSLTLIPYWMASTGGKGLGSNLVLRSEAVLELPKIFFRFLSFATPETSRFYSGGHGLGGSVSFLLDYPLALVVAVITTGVALVFLVQACRFYGQPPTSTLDRWMRILPVLIWIPFFLSVKGPSAHTFWILYPLCFYPLLKGLKRIPPWLPYVQIASLALTFWAYRIHHPDRIGTVTERARASVNQNLPEEPHTYGERVIHRALRAQ